MNLTLADLVQRFDNGGIRLPLMQRDYVWKPRKVVELLDSLYRGWPIGSFYVWHTQDDTHPTKARLGKVPRTLDGLYGFLLDGQQRLTSLSLAIQSEAETDFSRRAFFDIENERFYLGGMKRTVTKRIEAGDPLIVPLTDIVSATPNANSEMLRGVEAAIRNLREHGKLSKTRDEDLYRERLHKVAKMLWRPALYEEFDDDHEGHAFELFSRLNKGGTSLSAGDVEAARLASAALGK